MEYPYSHAALGGTFDHLHIGHYHLIETALKNAKKVTIGLTTEPLYQNKELSSLIQNYEVRERALKEYLREHGALDRVSIIPLQDPFGPTVDKNDIDVLVVSPQTLSGAKDINHIRQEKNLTTLPIVVTQLIQDQEGRYISSTRIRRGEISAQGMVYASLFKETLKLTANQKKVLAGPQGNLLTSLNGLNLSQLHDSPRVCLVGDQVTASFIQEELPFNYAIIDGQIMRSPTHHSPPLDQSSQLIAQNPPGSVTKEAAAALKEMIHQERGVLKIDGEEDLLAVPAALLLPLQSSILYGQPNRGIVHLVLTPEYKDSLYKLLAGQEKEKKGHSFKD